MQLSTLNDLLIHEVKDLYSAEGQIIQALPKMIKAATDPKLSQALTMHLQETEMQLSRMNEVADLVGEDITGHTCEGIKGIIMEGEKVLQASGSDAVKNAAIIAAAQRVEHYEMAGYGAAVAFARELGLDDVADLLDKTLQEEGNTNKKLTSLAEGGLFTEGVNEKALD